MIEMKILLILLYCSLHHGFSSIATAAADTNEDPQVPGYTRFPGNCRGFAVSGPRPVARPKLCAQLCDMTPECRGFSYSPYRGDCILKSQACDDPESSGLYVFFAKMTEDQRQTTDFGKHLNPDFDPRDAIVTEKGLNESPPPVSHDAIEADGEIEEVVQEDGEEEETQEDMERSATLRPQQDSDELPRTTKMPIVVPAGYEGIEGNCPGHTIPPTSSKPLQECAVQCSSTTNCAGFAHSSFSSVCLLKSSTCDNPVQGTEYRFYRKIGFIAPAGDEDDDEKRPVNFRAKLVQRFPLVTSNKPGMAGFTRADGDCVDAFDINMTETTTLSTTTTTASGGEIITTPDVQMPIIMYEQILFGPVNIPLKDCAERCKAARQCVGISFRFRDNTCLLRTKACDQVMPSEGSNFYLKETEPAAMSCAQTNEGTEFLVAFMANRAEQPAQRPLEVFITHPHDQPVNVSVSSSDGRANLTAVVEPYGVQRIEIPHDFRLSDLERGGIVVERKSIMISSSGPVVLYGVNKEYFTTDAFVALPRRSVGQRYYIACHFPPTFFCQFAVAATQDSTEVTITLPKFGATKSWQGRQPLVECGLTLPDGRRYSNGDTFRVRLNFWDALQLQDKCDLTGTLIVSDKPISVFSGNLRSSVGEGTSTRDHLVEQLVPVSGWGTDCAAVPTPNRTVGDFWTITAAEQSTDVSIQQSSGRLELVRLNAGETYRMRADPRSPMHIAANHPIMVVQYVHSQTDPREPADPSMQLCVPSEQFGFGYIFATPMGVATSYENYITVIIGQGMEKDLLIDGRHPVLLDNHHWVPIPGMELVTSYMRVEPGSHRVTHPNPTTSFAAYIYGAGDRESYAFPTGMCLHEVTCEPSFQVIGDGKDNDCDGVWDEELCGDNIDNDLDGLIDEDCYGTAQAELQVPPCDPGRTEGKQFVIMFLENKADQPANLDMEMYITQGPDVTEDALVTVTTPLFDNTFKKVQHLSPREIVTFTLPAAIKHEGTGKSNKAVLIESTTDILLYGVNRERFSSEGFAAIPLNELGTEYYAVCWYPTTESCVVGIVAVHDGTRVDVTLPPKRDSKQPFDIDGVARPDGNIVLNLDQYETYQIASLTDLTGARIKASRPIAVFSGNSRTSIVNQASLQSTNHLIEMLPPTSAWGNMFYTVPTPGRTGGDVFVIVASQRGTRVQITGQHQELYLDEPGVFRQIELPSTYCGRIQTDKPVMVVQFVKSQRYQDDPEIGFPAMSVVPSVQNYDVRYTFTTTDFASASGSGPETGFTNYIMLAIKGSQSSGLLVDGDTIDISKFRNVEGSDYVCAVVPIRSRVSHMVQHTLVNVPFMAQMYAHSTHSAHMMAIGFRLRTSAACVKCKQMKQCDGVDNDCDGQVEEEFCDGVDNDNDGLIDEDCCGGPPKCGLQTSEGTDFVLMFMENRPDQPKFLPLEIYVATNFVDGPVEVELSAPRFDSFSPVVRKVMPNDVTLFTVPNVLRMTRTSIENMGIRVRAVNPIVPLVVYGINKEAYTNDGFLGLPTAALGTDYFVVVWNPATIGGQFGIAATEDDTQIDIQFSNPMEELRVVFNGRAYSNNDLLKIRLDSYQTFLAINEIRDSDLTGTRIRSNKPIAVFSGNIRTSIEFTSGNPSRDHLVEQIPPTSVWGKRFVSVSTPGRTVGDYYKIVASLSNTFVTIRTAEKSESYLLAKAGDYKQVRIKSSTCAYIESDNPVLVTMFVLSQDGSDNPEKADPSMIIIPPVNQYRIRYTFSTTDYAGLTPGQGYTNYVMLAVPSRKVNGLLLDERSVKLSNVYKVANTDYSCGTITVQPGRHTLLHADHVTPFMGILYGAGDRESYAFPIGMELKTQTKCYPCPQKEACDNIDNDCDGKIEEEMCNGKDDDGDGLIDEDCCQLSTPAFAKCYDTKAVQSCYGDMANFTCPDGQVVKLISAHFGRIGYPGELSCRSPNPLNCHGVEQFCGFNDVYAVLEARCLGRPNCSVQVNQYSMGDACRSSPCQLCHQYLHAVYTCIDEQDMPCSILSSRAIGQGGDGSMSARFSASSTLSASAMATASPTSQEGVCSSVVPQPGEKCTAPECAGTTKPSPLDLHIPAAARFSSSSMHSWCPSFCDRNNSFVQIDLGGHYEVTGYLLQGARAHDQWVSRAGFAYSVDGKAWTEIMDNNTLKSFAGNTDSRSAIWCPLRAYNIVARYIRAVVLDYYTYPCLHFDIARCDQLKMCEPISLNNTLEDGIVWPDSGTPLGSSVTVNCRPGWMTVDRLTSFEMRCDSTGHWSGEPKHCTVPRDCGDIPIVDGALHDGRNSVIGSRVSYTCVGTHGLSRTIQGNATIVCQEDASWSQPPTCLSL